MEKKQFPINQTIFKYTIKGYLRQRSFITIKIQTNDDLHQQIRKHNEKLPKNQKGDKLQVLTKLQKQLI